MQDPKPSNLVVAEHIAKVQARLASACTDVYRNKDDVTLLAVSKRHPVDAIRQAYQAGLRQFGENFVQEGVDKIQALSALDITWHYIGRLQSNKAKLIARHFDWVQTVTTEKQLQLLSRYAAEHERTLQICLQVKLGDEASKGGLDQLEIEPLLEFANTCPNIAMRGLMAIPPASDHYDQQRQWFDGLAGVFERCKQRWPQLDTLSMGMSNDLEAAIAAGSTMVRIGTAIFGQRPIE